MKHFIVFFLHQARWRWPIAAMFALIAIWSGANPSWYRDYLGKNGVQDTIVVFVEGNGTITKKIRAFNLKVLYPADFYEKQPDTIDDFFFQRARGQ